MSKHLRVLREAGFVEARVDAQRRLYRIKPEPLMEIEASRYHATFVAKPIKPGEFLRTINELLSAVRRQRRWPS